jgi:hypothetical protein
MNELIGRKRMAGLATTSGVVAIPAMVEDGGGYFIADFDIFGTPV